MKLEDSVKFLRERVSLLEKDLEELTIKYRQVDQQRDDSILINQKLVSALNISKTKMTELKERYKTKMANFKCKNCEKTFDQQTQSFLSGGTSFDTGSFDCAQLTSMSNNLQ